MLRKKLKYDFLSTFRYLWIFFALSLLFGALTRLFFSFENSLALYIIGSIFNGATISMLCSLLINCLMRSWVQFQADFYGDEAYLTRTLPIRPRTLYHAKLLASLLLLLTVLLMTACTLAATYLEEGTLARLGDLLATLALGLDSTATELVVLVVLVLFAEFATLLQIGFFGLLAGHRRQHARIGYSVLFGFLGFLAAQLLILALIGVVAIFDENVRQVFLSSTAVSYIQLRPFLLWGLFGYGLDFLLLFFLNRRLFALGADVR